jgi:hypothetical protein
MAYTDFTLQDIKEKLNVSNQRVRLFPVLKSIRPSERLKNDLIDAQILPSRTEKAKSELIVSPILKELWRKNKRFFTIYSGEILNADAANGLNGECDFILAKDIGTYSINYPIIQIVEAKKNDIDLGIPQCAAQMIGAKLFNKRQGVEIDTIYGCVTTGEEWKFLKLEKDLIIDEHVYFINKLPEILAVLQNIIDYYKEVLK